MQTSACPVAHGVNWLDQDFLVDPFPKLAALREEGPVFFEPEIGHFLVTRYADVERCFMDRATFSAANASSPVWPVTPAAQRILSEHGYKRVPTLNNSDPPRHGPMRKAVFTTMSPRRLRTLEPELRSHASSLVEDLITKPVSDLVDDLAFPLPGHAGLSLLGFPLEDTDKIRTWSDKRVLLTYGKLADDEQVEVARNVVAFWNYVEDFVAARHAERRDDMTSDLLAYHDAQPEVVTINDVVNIVYSLALAGHDSTRNAIANTMRQLLTHRDQWLRLCQEPGLIPNAVEEGLRFDSSVLGHRRVATKDTEIGDVPIPAGSKLILLIASADHDGRRFPAADEFRVDRPNAAEHVMFGKGAHFCLGAPLARMELTIVLKFLTARAPGMRLVNEPEFPYQPNALFRTLEHLLVAPRPH
jgi:cytochrome P450